MSACAARLRADAFIGSLTTSIGTAVLAQRTGAHVSWEDARQHAPSLMALALIKVVASSLTNFCLMHIELALFKVTHAPLRCPLPADAAERGPVGRENAMRVGRPSRALDPLGRVE
eukprot:7381494-Prymnesium_polylepis.4